MTNLDFLTKDKFWGVVLIGLGITALIFRPFDAIDDKLKGAANSWLTFILVLLAIGTLGIAIFARPSIKSLLIFWIVTP
jgi:hypothetical protein